MSSDELFDPNFLERLRSLFFRLRKRRQLQKKGLQQTPSSGFTREFKDHRHYTPGDDYRAIDWRLYARLEKTFIRIFEEIQEFHVHILLDRSRSMAEPFGEKRIVASRLAIGMAYLALLSQHRVSLMTIGDEVRREVRPLKGQGHISTLLSQVGSLKFEGATDLVGNLKQFRPSRDRRGIVIIISDLFGRSPEMSAEAIAQSSRWPAETHVIQVLDPQEIKPSIEGDIRLIDVETQEVRRIWMTKRELARYETEFQNYLEELQRTCMQRQINYFTWSTDLPFEDTFVNMLSRGNLLAPTG